MDVLEAMRAWSRGRRATVLFWVLVLAAGAVLAEVAGIIVMGGPWELRSLHLHAANPVSRLAAAALLAFAAYVVRRGIHNNGREWGRFAGQVALCLFSTALAFLAAEIGLRLLLRRTQEMQSLDRIDEVARTLSKEQIQSHHPLAIITRKSTNPRLVFELRPGLDMEFGHRSLRTNKMGLREDRDYETVKGSNVFRIVGIGDSGMFGWDVHQGEEYLAVLESNLNARADGHVYEVLNFGVPGYNTQLEVECLRAKGLPYRPDVVVVGWCDNDFGLPYFIPQKGQWSRKDVLYLYYLLFNRKRYAELALNHVRDMRHYEKALVPDYFRDGTDISGVTQAFADLKAMGAQHGFKVLVMGPMQKEAQQICDKLGIACYNTWDRIPGKAYPKEYMVHFMHPRAEGHRVLAEHIENELADLGWLPSRQAAPTGSAD